MKLVGEPWGKENNIARPRKRSASQYLGNARTPESPLPGLRRQRRSWTVGQSALCPWAGQQRAEASSQVLDQGWQAACFCFAKAHAGKKLSASLTCLTAPVEATPGASRDLQAAGEGPLSNRDVKAQLFASEGIHCCWRADGHTQVTLHCGRGRIACVCSGNAVDTAVWYTSG